MRRFRMVSITAIAGVPLPDGPTRLERTECVAQGVLFHDGTVVLRWLGETPSTAVYGDLATLRQIHHVIPHPVTDRETTGGVLGPEGRGEVGQRYLCWEDPICFACGAHLFFDERRTKHCSGCGAGQAASGGHWADEADPSLGSWQPALVIGGES